MKNHISIKSAKDLIISISSAKETVKTVETLVANGVAGGAEALHFFKFLEKLSKIALSSKILRDDFINEVENGLKEYRGALLEVVETGVKYDFSNSEAWTIQKKIVDRETEKLKSIEKMCKSATRSYKPIDDETAELLPNIAPPITTSITSPKITIR